MNPILNQIGTINQEMPTIQRVKNAYQMAKLMASPEMALEQAMNNPQMVEVMRLVRENGGDPKATFYKLAEQKGVDPEEVLKELNG